MAGPKDVESRGRDRKHAGRAKGVEREPAQSARKGEGGTGRKRRTDPKPTQCLDEIKRLKAEMEEQKRDFGAEREDMLGTIRGGTRL